MNKKILTIGMLIIGILIFGYTGRRVFSMKDRASSEIDKEKAIQRLLQVKVASLYENITDPV
ncbi:MAG: hypothetical protein KAS70_06745, partial [Planctomycetes bacterium]|nr:hypothetical protein [Planctomycetota bacterium]